MQSGLILNRVRQMAKDKDIPVLVFCEDVAASGGYMLALAGDEIFAHDASVIGSIGVIYAGFGYSEAIKKLGIQRRVHTAGENKAMLDPFSPEKKEDVERIKALQGEIHEYFKAQVRERRGRRLRGKRSNIFNGDVWTAKEAKKLGLIDDIGDMRSVLKDRFGERVRIRAINPKKPKFGGLRGLIGNASGRISQDYWPASWSDDLLESIETRSMWDRWGL